MPTLLAWRATCRPYHRDVAAELQDSVRTLIAPFVPDQKAFLDLIVEKRALIIGEAALSYILRHPSPTVLELSLGSLVFEEFMTRFRELPGARENIHTLDRIHHPPTFLSLRQISKTTVLHLISGATILVHESASTSPCSAVAGSWTSALMNFVTPYSFGCAYPRLMLCLRGLICEPRLSALTQMDYDLVKRMFDSFSLSTSLNHWPPRRNGDNDSEQLHWTLSDGECGKSLYLCLNQSRYFGDGGSLVVFYDISPATMIYVYARGVAPYGTMVAWRLLASEICSSGCTCDSIDTLLPQEVTISLLRLVDAHCIASCKKCGRPPFTYKPSAGTRRTRASTI